MKKLLFVIGDMKIGGIQKALLELLKTLDKRKYDISLFCCKQAGELLQEVPCDIHVLSENVYAKIVEEALGGCKAISLKCFVLRFVLSVLSKLFTKSLPAWLLCKLIGKISGEYDVAISYSQPINDRKLCNLTNEIVLNCAIAKGKFTFLHCDYGNYGGNSRVNRKLYRKFDAVAAVSDSVGKRFLEFMPEMQGKVFTVRNCFDFNYINSLANIDEIIYLKQTIVSVCRLSPEKGLCRCMPIIKTLKGKGFEFEWHIVGGGSEEAALKQLIAENDLETTVFLHGNQKNPYRYIKNASFLFLPSFHEAAPVVFDEAIALKVPILTTRTLSAEEMVGSRFGCVCENNEAAILSMLEHALKGKVFCNYDKVNHSIGIEQFDELCNK